MTGGRLLAIVALCVALSTVKAHGSMQFPPTRQYYCWENPSHPACPGTQNPVTYNWNEVGQYCGAGVDCPLVRDGELCSGQNWHDGASYYDEVREYHRTPINFGSNTFIYHTTAEHLGTYEVYLTKDSAPLDRPLRHEDLELVCTYTYGEGMPLIKEFPCNINVERTRSEQVIYINWRTAVTANEQFMGCADVTIDGNVPTPTEPQATATATGEPTTTESPLPESTETPQPQCVVAWDQCGGLEYSGVTDCCAGLVCTVVSDWWHSCQPGNTVPTPTEEPSASEAITEEPQSTATPTQEPQPTSTPTSSPGGQCVAIYDQCGGNDYQGPTNCCDGLVCTFIGPYWSQCNVDQGQTSSPPSPQPTNAPSQSPTQGPEPTATPQPSQTPTVNPVPTATTEPHTTSTEAPPTPAPTNPAPTGETGWERSITPKDIAEGHPWGISNLRGKNGLEAATIIYHDIANAIRNGPPSFQAFCNTADPETNKREAAAFLANVLKETGGYGAFVEVSPVGEYCTALGGIDPGMMEAGRDYPCCEEGYGCDFRGRGAIQLTWNINYGRFSEFYYGDKNVLLRDPELVVGDGEVGWAASLWFWMTRQDYGGACPPVQLTSSQPVGNMSCHEAMTLADGGGFGQTIRIINGGYESCPTSGYRSSPIYRVQYYFELTSLLQVPSAPNCDYNEDCDVSGMEFYESSMGRVGNVLIGSDTCVNCQRTSCTKELVTKWLGVNGGPTTKYQWTCN
mmetsp:Transcript_23280/g.92738  ORF Transcript_23280/g.92738 Transcript_23280/m.92738 type:complete len:737 (-) Transcript_23280:1541-3751(-)